MRRSTLRDVQRRWRASTLTGGLAPITPAARVGWRPALPVRSTSSRLSAQRGGLATVSLEQVLAWDPEVIVTIDRDFADSVRGDPNWASVAAVRLGRVHSPKLPFGWVDFPPAANRLIGLRWLGKVLYPDLFPEDLELIAREFYARFYHVTVTDERSRTCWQDGTDAERNRGRARDRVDRPPGRRRCGVRGRPLPGLPPDRAHALGRADGQSLRALRGGRDGRVGRSGDRGVAAAVWSALSVAGAAFQGLFRNPLVSPDILGAALGAVLAIYFSLGVFGIQALAFIGGAISRP